MDAQDHSLANGDDARALLMKVLDQRDPLALGALYSRYGHRLGRYLSHHFVFDADVMDLVHEVFVCLWQGQCGYDNESNVLLYLMGIARNIARRHGYRARRRLQAHSAFCDAESTGHGAGEPEDDRAGPAQITQDKEIQDKVLAAMTRVPLKSREALELVYLCEMRPSKRPRSCAVPFPYFATDCAMDL